MSAQDLLSSASSWLDSLVKNPDISGDLQSFLIDNRKMILEIGKDLFIEFLSLLYRGKREEATELLINNMTDMDDLTSEMNDVANDQIKQNAINLKYQEFALKILEAAGSVGVKILLGMLITAVI
jgi:hypothetical protein